MNPSLRRLLFLGPGRHPHRFLEDEVVVGRRSSISFSGGQDVVDDVLDVGVGAQQLLKSRLYSGQFHTLVIVDLVKRK